MKLRTLLIALVVAVLPALMIMGRTAAAEEAERYPLIAYAPPAEKSLVSLHTTAAETGYLTEQSLFSCQTPSVKAEDGIIAVWRERVFKSLSSANLTPDVKDGGHMVVRTTMKESMNLVLERNPGIAQIVKVLKLEVSTDMFARDEGEKERNEAPAAPALPARPQAVKDRFFMKTSLQLPIDQGTLGLTSKTSAVYGNFTSFVNVRLDSKHDSSLGLRYALSRDMQVQVERTTADAADPALGWAVRQSVSNILKVVCSF